MQLSDKTRGCIKRKCSKVHASLSVKIAGKMNACLWGVGFKSIPFSPPLGKWKCDVSLRFFQPSKLRDVITFVGHKRVYKSPPIKLSILIFNLVLLLGRIFVHVLFCFLNSNIPNINLTRQAGAKLCRYYSPNYFTSFGQSLAERLDCRAYLTKVADKLQKKL